MKFVSISSLQKTTKPMIENEVVCVLKNNEPVFYTITPERMKQIVDAEESLKDLQKQLNDLQKQMPF